MLTVKEITNKIFNGDSLEVLKQFPSNSIDLVVCSPPYHNQRNYHNKEQIGMEKSVKEYIDNLFQVFKQCKRVMKNTASLWINIADSFDERGCLKGVPERLRLKLQDDLDVICRNVIVWWKPSCMPSSAKTRFTIDYELFYFFVKEPKGYYFETQYEPMKTFYKDNELNYKGTSIKDYNSNKVQDPSDTKRRILENIKKRNIIFGGNKYTDPNQMFKADGTNYKVNTWVPNENLERIKRTVWSINTPNSIESHFATYPEQLIEIPIKACTNTTDKTLVLDPFLGSGTTAIKAQKMGRSYCGIELNPSYVSIVNRRLKSMITSYLTRE